MDENKGIGMKNKEIEMKIKKFDLLNKVKIMELNLINGI